MGRTGSDTTLQPPHSGGPRVVSLSTLGHDGSHSRWGQWGSEGQDRAGFEEVVLDPMPGLPGPLYCQR